MPILLGWLYWGWRLARAEWLPTGLPANVLAIVAIGSLFTAVRRLRRIALRLRGTR